MLGPLVTPLSRRRPHKLARETVTLDRLSGGRLVLGVGLGSDPAASSTRPFGEEADPRARARLLDEGLDRLLRLLGRRVRAAAGAAARGSRSGSPRAGRTAARCRRAARWDGLFPIDLPGPEALAELAAEVRELRGAGPARSTSWSRARRNRPRPVGSRPARRGA